jgi:hypothetical protein
MAGGISSLGMIAPIDLEIASTVFTFSGEPQFSGIRQIALQGASLTYEPNPRKGILMTSQAIRDPKNDNQQFDLRWNISDSAR